MLLPRNATAAWRLDLRRLRAELDKPKARWSGRPRAVAAAPCALPRRMLHCNKICIPIRTLRALWLVNMTTIRTVGVIGAGQMGNGIAHVCALAGTTCC